jgi:hypothetical protein
MRVQDNSLSVPASRDPSKAGVVKKDVDDVETKVTDPRKQAMMWVFLFSVSGTMTDPGCLVIFKQRNLKKQ